MSESVLKKIDELSGRYLDMLEDICNIESPTSDKNAVDAVGSYFVNIANAFGWKVERFEQPISGDVVCITMNSDAKEAPITVSGHIDTVHPVGAFGIPAVRRDSENMYGPGVMDCKGGVVAALMAMDALEKCGFKKRPVQLILQTDEETGSATSGKATIDYMCKRSVGSIAFLNLEGHKSGTAVLIRKGILRYRFTVRGKALHSSRCFDASNAITEAAYKIIELEKMKEPDGLTCNCGVINGGTVANSVAESCIFYADIRFADQKDMERAKAAVKKISETSNVPGCICEVEEISYRPAMPYSEKNNALLDKMNEIYRSCGLPTLKARSCLSGSDAAYITECGIPCVDCIGTEGSNIHSVDEYIRLESLAESAKRIAAVIYNI